MLRPTLTAVFLISSFVFWTSTWAQTVYRCGGSYSQTPCSGGVAIDASDPRSSAQKMQSDGATRRDASTADAMRQTRLEQERRDIAADEPGLDRELAAASSEVRAGKLDKKKKKKRDRDRTQGLDLSKSVVKKTEKRP